MSEKRPRNEKMLALLAELRHRSHWDINETFSASEAYKDSANLLEAAVGASAAELDARPCSVFLPKFRPGEQVWVAKQVRQYKQCPCCSGTGERPGDDGQVYTCGNCHGDAQVFDADRYEPRLLAIVRAGAFCERADDGPNFLYALTRDINDIEEYRLHATEEGCREVCERMNAGEWGRAI